MKPELEKFEESQSYFQKSFLDQFDAKFDCDRIDRDLSSLTMKYQVFENDEFIAGSFIVVLYAYGAGYELYFPAKSPQIQDSINIFREVFKKDKTEPEERFYIGSCYNIRGVICKLCMIEKDTIVLIDMESGVRWSTPRSIKVRNEIDRRGGSISKIDFESMLHGNNYKKVES